MIYLPASVVVGGGVTSVVGGGGGTSVVGRASVI